MKLSYPIFDLPNIMSPHELTIVGLTLLFLSGCAVIPLPNPEPEPFPEKVTRTIVPGKTSRKDVLSTLGNPRFATTDGKLFIYAEAQLTKLLIVFLPAPGGVIGRIGPTHYYIISFARNGTVANTKIATKISDYCRRDGSCLVTEGDLNFWYAPAAIEASAKKFTPISDKCTIYLLNLMPSAMVLKIAIDRRKTIQFPNLATLQAPINGGIGGRLFHRIVVPAGIHELSFPKKMTSSGRPVPRTFRQRPLSFQCHAGDVIFVAHSLKIIRGLPYMMPVEFTLVDPEKAKRKILKMRMLDPGK